MAKVRLIDANACPALFDEEFKETRQLIFQGETHLDNLAEGFSEAAKVIRNMPTIDPESLRPKGRWEYHDCVCTGDGLTSVYSCCECHGAIDEEVFDNLHSTHYCPNCGANMR